MSSHLYVVAQYSSRTTRGDLEKAGLDWGEGNTGSTPRVWVDRVWGSKDNVVFHVTHRDSHFRVAEPYSDTPATFLPLTDLRKGDPAKMRAELKEFCESRGLPFQEPDWYVSWEYR